MKSIYIATCDLGAVQRKNAGLVPVAFVTLTMMEPTYGPDQVSGTRVDLNFTSVEFSAGVNELDRLIVRLAAARDELKALIEPAPKEGRQTVGS